MPRYADMEIAEEYIKKLPDGFEMQGYERIIADILDALDCTPAADVQEVKHAYWRQGSVNGTEYCYCSECKEDALQDKEGYTKLSDFCPNCGAKMDKEG